MDRPVISLLTDFGPEPAAICRGVMLSIARDAQVVEISHDVRKFAIRDGAFLLWCALPYLPVGHHVGVVDPGVGTARLPIAIRTGRGDVLVGPDNGLFRPVAERLGGIVEARALENRALGLPVRTMTFHGRDLFAPVAAHLAMGTPFEAVGPVVPVTDLVDLAFPRPAVAEGVLETAVLLVDNFGNIRLAGLPGDLEAALGPLRPGDRLVLDAPATPDRAAIREATSWQGTFGEVPIGVPLVYEDSFGTLSFADNQGNVAARLGLAVDRTLTIRRSQPAG